MMTMETKSINSTSSISSSSSSSSSSISNHQHPRFTIATCRDAAAIGCPSACDEKL
jgi:hypothetical protein